MSFNLSKDSFIIVTGGAGFIGSNLVQYLNEVGISNIIIVDNLAKIRNNNILSKCNFNFSIDYTLDNSSIENKLKKFQINTIFHLGADTNVLNDNINKMLKTNFDSSVFWLEMSKKYSCDLIYASSSAIYGSSKDCSVSKGHRNPLNEYALSKSFFDDYIRLTIKNELVNKKVIGYRFFNVFGPGENDKNKNASIPFRFFEFMIKDGCIELFNKNILRDYVYVKDLVKILFLTKTKNISSGIYNLGSGEVTSHKKIANIVLSKLQSNKMQPHIKNFKIIEVEIPDHLKNKFQFYTKATELESWIKNSTKGSREKIEVYIDYLINDLSV